MLPTLIPVVATSYCDSGYTKTGTYAHPGTVAVDPAFIPMRSRLRIFVRHAGAWMERFARPRTLEALYRAEDTGADIRGARIDIWQSDCSQAILWGRQTVALMLADHGAGELATQARTRARLSLMGAVPASSRLGAAATKRARQPRR